MLGWLGALKDFPEKQDPGMGRGCSGKKQSNCQVGFQLQGIQCCLVASTDICIHVIHINLQRHRYTLIYKATYTHMNENKNLFKKDTLYHVMELS